MSNAFTPITIIPIELAAGDESAAFREVIAYLNGIADTVSASQPDYGRALSLAPMATFAAMASLASLAPIPSLAPIASLAPFGLLTQRSSSEVPGGTRVTLRFGELPFEHASLWPQVALGAAPEPTRGGARTLDFGFDSVRACSLAPNRRWTLPYDAPSDSMAPQASSLPPWYGERQSEVRLRAGQLPPEWYELTGTDDGSAR
jgi:hypothetical protein